MADETNPTVEGTPFQKLIRRRRSIRRFLETPVEPEKVRACLEAARIAPSSHNAQPWRFVVVDDAALKDRLATAAFSGIYGVSKFGARAPILVVLLAKRDLVAHHLGARFQKVPYFLIDMGIAGEHFVLQAEELGLSTCWMGWINYRRIRKVLRVPRKFMIVAMMPLGYAEKRPQREPPRRRLEEIGFFNRVPGA